MLVKKPNFLILDEPTNDLDILTLQVLEEYLSDFAGCVIIVSHDRFFMDKVANHLLCFEGEGFVRDFPGNYSLYREWQEMKSEEERLKRESEASKRVSNSAPTNAKPTENRPVRLSYAEKRELEEIEQKLPKLTEEKESLEQALSSGNLSSDELIAASTRIGELIDLMDELVLRQLELEEKVS